MNVCVFLCVCVLVEENPAAIMCVCGRIAQTHVVLLGLSGLFGLDTVDLV